MALKAHTAKHVFEEVTFGEKSDLRKG